MVSILDEISTVVERPVWLQAANLSFTDRYIKSPYEDHYPTTDNSPGVYWVVDLLLPLGEGW